MSILIFDDDKKTIEPSISILEKNLSGLGVNYTDNPEKAMKYILSGNCKILVLEVLTPRITGIEICEYLASDDRLKNVSVILISELPLYSEKFSQSLADRKELSMVKGVLEKPFSPYDLLAKIISVNGTLNTNESSD